MLTSNVDESQAILIVIPSDIGAYRRYGQVKGARMIHNLVKKLNLETKILDYGELFVDHFNLRKTHEIIDAEIRKTKEFGKPLIIIGGDHSISYGCMKNYPDAQIYMFDAHPDLINEKKYITHGSFLSHFKNRAKLYGTRYKTRYESQEIPTLGEIDTRKVYVSIDLDVLDPSIMPGVSHPVSRGWSLEQLKNELDKLFKEKEIVCIDLVEFSAVVEHVKSLKAIENLLEFIFNKYQ